MVATCRAPLPTEPDLCDLQARLGRCLGPNIGTACRDVDGDPRTLLAAELFSIRKAVPRRQREFAAGRTAASDAMRQVGCPPHAITCADDRSPVWPEGLIGSIAHCRSACVAIVASSERVHAMGIDIEEDLPLDPGLWASVCTPAELHFLASMSTSEQGLWALRIFCAKEAYYKWQFPLTRRLLAFQDVEVCVDVEHSRFAVHATGFAEFPVVTCARQGHLLSSQGMVVAWLVGPPAVKALCSAHFMPGNIAKEPT